MSEEKTPEVVEETVTQEYVNLQDVMVFTGIQKEYLLMQERLKLVQEQMSHLETKLEFVKVQLSFKYKLNQDDLIDEKTGLITRK